MTVSNRHSWHATADDCDVANPDSAKISKFESFTKRTKLPIDSS